MDTVEVVLSNGQTLHVQATPVGAEESLVAGGGEALVAGVTPYKFSDAMKTIEGLALELGGVLARVSPTKASIEFEIELGVEAGQLTALLVKGSGKANLKLALEWSTDTGSK